MRRLVHIYNLFIGSVEMQKLGETSHHRLCEKEKKKENIREMGESADIGEYRANVEKGEK